jgi:hypothetical protein
VLGEVCFIGSFKFEFGFELLLALFCHFTWFAVFVPFTSFVILPSSR